MKSVRWEVEADLIFGRENISPKYFLGIIPRGFLVRHSDYCTHIFIVA